MIAPEEKAALLELADRCEREGASPELDADISVATGVLDAEMGHHWTRPFTTSLDAAVTLVPEGFVWSADNLCGPTAFVIGGEDGHGNVPEGRSDTLGTKTVALALCAAALRARASLSPSPAYPREEGR